MAGTKRPNCWIDYDSDESDTLTEGDSTTKLTIAPTVAPDSKRRKVESHSQPRGGPPSSKPISSSSNLATTTTSSILPTSPARRPTRHGRDLLSPLSDELLIRILSFLPLQHLLSVAPVSRRFYHLAGDSQLWKALYYARFVLPRAMRIPGFRFNGAQPTSGTGTGHKLHYKGRRRLWVDGRRGGIVDDQYQQSQSQTGLGSGEDIGLEEKEVTAQPGVNWKRQYKIRYNWSRGKCVVEELKVGGDPHEESDGRRHGTEKKKMLAKVVEGIAITADEASGLRAWDLKTRKLVAQVDLATERVAPSCIAIDEKQPDAEVIDVSLGFVDGSFGVWRVFVGQKRIEGRYRHQKSSNGELIAMAFAYPYILTATESVLISLYTFDVPEKMADTGKARDGPLPAPYLLTSLNSHTSRPPLALSIRRAATTTIASIAYTFSTRRGWSIGIQDLHIRPSNVVGLKSTPEITTTQIAYTTPMDTGYVLRLPPTPPTTPRRHGIGSHRYINRGSTAQPPPQLPPPSPEPGPTSLCYTHPYLLATLPDNTLILHMCNSNASSLSISDGIRLWGHTSGVSDAEVTARGKAVSVSTRGEEMRVWELEGGRMTGIGSSRGVEIKPGSSSSSSSANRTGLEGDSIGYDWEERRNWVGFDDEMVIVLKERGGPGSESLMVYDFT
ncbi:hypothetical protein QBC37DRAFT_81180 [Rhypophila decipiens]|uniref:F-box domain-containing protein n=1 Tax=Rhypophila decipiens TaxID=261697 RepID=A0AAN6YCJ6_9PEZI|nr:hypothetical protein QBC37DRAFT_81180 [Rhypophila decipiens]